MRRPTGIDLFSGAGGLSLGFEQAGFDVVAAVEIDPIHAAVHEYNFPDTRVFCMDITQLTGDELLTGVGMSKGEVDVVFGGSPCQGFSLIGKRLIDDSRNALLGHFARIVDEVRPKYFVLENVSGLTVGYGKEALQQLISEMEEVGYQVIPYQVLNAANYGVPQSRKRVFVIGYREDVQSPMYPDHITKARGKNGITTGQDSFLPWCPSIYEAISDLPDVDQYEELVESDKMVCSLEPRSEYAAILHGLIDDPGDYSYRREWDRSLLTSSMRTEHTPKSRARFAETVGGTVESISRFFRLHNEGISNTLRAGTDSKRGAYTSPRPIHPIYNRVISVREAARIHSFPDWFRFHVTKWHGFREVGNSVPPLLARAVAKEIIHAMGIEPVRPNTTLKLGDENLLSLDMSSAATKFNVPRDVIGNRNRVSAKEVQHV